MTRLNKNQIKKILENFPETRNSDALLMIEVWKNYYGLQFPCSEKQLLETIRDASPETIRRTRQWFNQAPRFELLPTSWQVAKMRGVKREHWERFLKFEMGKEPKNHYEAAGNPPIKPREIPKKEPARTQSTLF